MVVKSDVDVEPETDVCVEVCSLIKCSWLSWEYNSTKIVGQDCERGHMSWIVQYSDDHSSPHMAAVLFSYVHCKGSSKARMLATLLSRDERDQLQPWL